MRPVIKNVVQLCKDIAYYANMFPGVEPVTYDWLEKSMEDHQEDWPEGHIYGVSVSPAWEDKCFIFDVLENDSMSFVVEYKGVRKC